MQTTKTLFAFFVSQYVVICKFWSPEATCMHFCIYTQPVLCGNATYTLVTVCIVTYLFILPHTHLGCSSTQFRCTNGQCITTSNRCTGIRTCSDGSDERNCRKLVVFPTLCAWILKQLLALYPNSWTYYFSLMLKWRLSVQQSSMCSIRWPLWWDTRLHWWQRWDWMP